ncbi:hypothetical protein [Micromonospora eburnea]|uniref:hypothetical protein n=1 Tax=Micromonospora eburnea TaxID=227316 RepID=UPI000B85E446|nr:hypothetical protein [Micromonospora eburnea]
MTVIASAIPMVAKTLADLDLLHRDPSQPALRAAMIDDIVGWVLLSLAILLLLSAAATTAAIVGAHLVGPG